MNKTVSCILYLALSVTLVGTGFAAGIFIDNAEFDDESIAVGGWTDNIEPWVCDNITGGDDAWISNGFDPNEPEPITPLLYTMGNIVYQVLSATYQEGAAYIFSVDVAVWDYTDDWTIFLYDATTGDHMTPLVSRSSADVGEEPIPVLCQWYRKSVMFVVTASEVGHQIGIGLAGGSGTMFDNAELEPPVRAWGPDPYDGEINVFVDRTLSWHTAKDPNDPAIINPAITGHKVYMRIGGTPYDPNNMDFKALIPATGDTAEYIPETDWERDETYYWRVDEVSGANTIMGDVWMFQTVSTAPVIDEATPMDVLVYEGTNPVFTVSAYNPFTGDANDLSFQWYKVSEPDDEMLADGVNYSGVQTKSLRVLDVQLSDEGYYYCVATNTVGEPESSTSRSASLTIKKMVAHWKFDETEGVIAADSSIGGGDNSGTVQTLNPNPDSVWSPDGIVDGGGALNCDGWSTWVDTYKYAAELGIEGNKPRSVSAWVYTKGFNNGGVFDVGRRLTNQDFGLRTLGATDQWRVQYWGQDRDFVYPSKNTWVHFVHTHGAGGTKVYADGQVVVDWPEKVLNTGDDFTFRIGHYGPNNEKFYGLIDDVRLYNYALDQLEAINLYFDVKPDETVCLSYPALDFTGPDGEPDCVVGLFEFAVMASEWMQCNIVPDCIQ